MGCERCDDEVAKQSLLSKVGLSSAQGYECENCGTLLCDDCYRERQKTIGMARHDHCPNCDGRMRHR